MFFNKRELKGPMLKIEKKETNAQNTLGPSSYSVYTCL